MYLMRKCSLTTVFLAGLILRLILMFTASSFDINNHISWAQDAYIRGFAGFYETRSREIYAWPYPNYPPLSIFIFYLVYAVKQPIFNILWWLNIKIPFFPSKIFTFLGTREYTVGLYKLPAIIFDLILAYLCYLFAKKLFPKNKQKHILAASLILFNPMFFYISSLWGQTETIVLSFFLISIYFLMFSKKPILSFIFFILSFLVKPVMVIFLPIYIIYFLKNYGVKKVIFSLFISNIIFWLFFLPFYRNGNLPLFPYVTYFEKILLSQSMSNVSNSAFNFWTIFPILMHTADTGKIIGPFTYRAMGYAIVAILYLIIIASYLKRTKSIAAFFSSLFLTGFSYIIFSTKMHERYFVYLLPPLLLAALKVKKLIKWYVFFSILFFINLYYSWSIPYFDLIGILKNNITIIVLSLTNFFSFLYFSKQRL